MDAALMRWRISPAAVERGTQPALHRLDRRLVFYLDLVERSAGGSRSGV
jgi:hypothetical protein